MLIVPEQVIQVYPSKCCIIITANAGYGHLGALVLACSEYGGLGINSVIDPMLGTCTLGEHPLGSRLWPAP
jgi:hypothetical protein